jgi:hypothetical protein
VGQISILSWNVHGLKSKLCDSDFISLVSSYDVFFLTETWTNRNDPYCLDIVGYECDHVYGRKFARRGRFSGGVSVYYRSHLKDYVSVIEKCENNLIWLKMNDCLFDFNCNVVIGCVYMVPDKGKASRREDTDLFEMLEQGIAKHVDSKVILVGDFNARTGTRSDELEILRPDRYVDTTCVSEFVNIVTRVSEDHVIDTPGRRLLDLCKSAGLVLANGRLGSDRNVGHVTFVGACGKSVVDYCLLRPDDCKYVSEFNVLPLNELSDHSPISLCVDSRELNTAGLNKNTEHTCVNKLVWDESKADGFRRDLLANVDCLHSFTDKLNEAEREEDISNIVSEFTDFVFDQAFCRCGVSYTPGRPRRTRPNHGTTHTWFTSECVKARIDFCKARNVYLRERSDESRIIFVKCRSHFNAVKRKARNAYKCDEGRKLAKLARTNPRKFWKAVKQGKHSKANDSNLIADDFLQHFSEVYGGVGYEHVSAETENPINVDELDKPISVDEIECVVRSLQKQKSCGLDSVCAEVYQAAFDILSPFIVTLFNILFERGLYPSSWGDGLIVPVHKKGDVNNASNYRAITLVTVISKIYSHVLTARLHTWAENYDKISINQFGFQKNKSTADCIFVFHSIVSKVLSSGNKLYCAFVDFQRAFDNVNRDYLWYKLVQEGVSSKLLSAVKAIYNSVRSCVKHNDCMSDFFQSHCGVKQGEPLSPFLFVLFINDMVSNINHDLIDIVDVHALQLFLLLYADDSVFFAKSKESLQSMMNDLQDYCCTWGLTVNTEKTKVMVFENGRKTEPIIYYNNVVIDVVEYFSYLGVTLYKNGGWYRTQKGIRDRGMYALHRLFNTLYDISLPVNEQIRLFDSLVTSVLNYGAEVWGHHVADDVEQVHLKFCRYVLGVKKSTNTVALYGELGRMPLIVFRKLRILKYWTAMLKDTTTLRYKVYSMLRYDVEHGNTYRGKNWAFNVKRILEDLGLSYVWAEQDLGVHAPASYFKQRLCDQYKQNWAGLIYASPKLVSYVMFKSDFECEPYMYSVNNIHHRKSLSRFRTSSHDLYIESGRYNNIPRENRLCKLCNMNVVENEYHFLLACPLYKQLRMLYLPHYYCSWPTKQKFTSLMSSSSRSLLQKLAKYIFCATKLRNIHKSTT